MSKFNVPASPDLHYRRYQNLKGMDCSRDMTEIRPHRSPDLLNMISDNGGDPVKRVGWREIWDVSSNIGNGKHLFYTTFTDLDGKEQKVALAVGEKGISIFKKDEEGMWSAEYKGMGEDYSNCKFYHFNGKAYMFGNKLYSVGPETYIGTNVSGTSWDELRPVPEYVPEVVISRSPDGTGGTFHESVNVLTDSRKISFIGESQDGKYYLYPQADLNEDAYKYISKIELFVEVMNEDGIFVQATDFELTGEENITVPNIMGDPITMSVCSPVIKINDPIASPVEGQDNVRITFVPVHAVSGLYKKERHDLWNANIVKAYGYTNTDRLFVVTGDRTIRYSDVNNPTYFPEDNCLTVSHKGKIVGLHRYQGYLVAVTDDNEAESTVFFIHGSEYDGAEFYAVKPATGGIGAIAPMSFGTLVDEPLFLTKNGIYAISSTSLESRTVVRNRSYFIDRKLKEEPNLENATAVVWNNYYILCVNDHCYVLDGRNTSNERGNNTNYVYECYYWENVPAACFCECDGELYFISIDGKFCKFNTDVLNQTKYSDGGRLAAMENGKMVVLNGVAIPCRWSTILDDDGYANYFKTMTKKGPMLTIVPHMKSSVKVSCSVDGDTPEEIATVDATDVRMQDIFLNKKLKKYKRLQLIFENDAVNEPFGLISVIKTYIVNNLAK